MHNLPWARTERRGADPRHRRTVAELPRAATLRFSAGARAGPWSPLMAPNVIQLTLDDIVALAAYAASLQP